MKKLLIALSCLIISMHIYAKENNSRIILKISNKKCFSTKKVLEIKNLDSKVINIVKDEFFNKICIIPLKIGSSRVYLLEADGRKRATIFIDVVKKYSKIEKENLIKKMSSDKLSLFDKEMKNKYILDGWRER